jgi:hypothetical protein
VTIPKVRGHGIFTRNEMKDAIATAEALVNASTYGSQPLADILKLIELRRQTDQLVETLSPLSTHISSIDASLIRIADALDRFSPKRLSD